MMNPATIEDEEELEDWPAGISEQLPQGFATQTAFDSYFLQASKPSRTSSNVFSSIVPPLSPEEFTAAISRQRSDHVLWQDPEVRNALFSRYLFELQEGFNLLFYGCGSKRDVLNAFARLISTRKAHVVVANGFQPSFAFKDLLNAIEQIPGVEASFITSTSIEAQTQRMYDFFADVQDDPAPELYIVVHNIEGPAFRATKAKSCLSLLALNPHVHLIASIDHIAAPLRWTLTDLFSRKSDGTQAEHGQVPRRGFAWLWHDLTTLAPYDFELAYSDPNSLSCAPAIRGARSGRDGTGTSTPGPMAETAARHVLASVTQKAQKLFALLGAKQLELMSEDASAGGAASGAFDYARLFNAARDGFIATNDTSLRSLLSEFRDHGLVVSTVAAGAEALWIPLRKEALAKIVHDLRVQEP
ncbi:Origin recognition complex subunit 2 [Grifola frondosa]|uniref:Origin recognition complex subunit 2 n=1 Tax=Grifola frondosa TaxID=5627 RepID=A0A1C7MFE4_GRIFR|nr:Origin recognition complex subunit 2 [Grifola frondosa]